MTASYLSPSFLDDVGLDKDQVLTLKKAFDAFDHEKKGAITTETTGIGAISTEHRSSEVRVHRVDYFLHLTMHT